MFHAFYELKYLIVLFFPQEIRHWKNSFQKSRTVKGSLEGWQISRVRKIKRFGFENSENPALETSNFELFY